MGQSAARPAHSKETSLATVLILGPGRAETRRTAVSLFEIIGPGRLRGYDLFDDELAYLASRRQNRDLVPGVVEQAYDLAAIVCVDDARQHIDALFNSKPGTRCNATVEAFRDGHA